MTLTFERLILPDKLDRDRGDRDTWRAHYRRVQWRLLARAVFIAAPSSEIVIVRVPDFPDLIWDKGTVGIHGVPTGPIVEDDGSSEDEALTSLGLHETYLEIDRRLLGQY